MNRMEPVEELEKLLSDFEKAKMKLEKYLTGAEPLPSSQWDLEETCDMQRSVISEIFNSIIFRAMALERINALPLHLSEQVAVLQK